MTVVLRQMLDHQFTRAHASAYLDGELSPTAAARVDRHTSICPKCRALIASLRRTLDALPSLAARPQRLVADGVLERLRRAN